MALDAETHRVCDSAIAGFYMKALPVHGADIDLRREGFMHEIVCELVSALEDVVGEEEAAGFVSLVGQRMGERIDADYRKALGVERLNAPSVGAALVDLKNRIDGGFRLVKQTEQQIVLENGACPFGNQVQGRHSLCMMTSNVFGTLVAENLGYARVDLDETIAGGAPACVVKVHLQPGAPANQRVGREYFRDTSP